jgi:hypothetical protein
MKNTILNKLANHQIPNNFKKIGGIIFFSSFILLVGNQLFFEKLNLSIIAKYGLLIGMFLWSISKEKIEDELILKLRMQSYTFAFLIVVIFTLLHPLMSYLVDFVIDDNKSNISDYGDFEILWLLLGSQLWFFEIQKRLHK